MDSDGNKKLYFEEDFKMTIYEEARWEAANYSSCDRDGCNTDCNCDGDCGMDGGNTGHCGGSWSD